MKALNQFIVFDCERFFAGKTMKYVGSSGWSDYNTKAHLGTKVEAVIAEDKTAYKQKDGACISNLYEKIVFKCRKDVGSIPSGASIVPVNPVATVYGEYRNLLSITCDDIRVVSGNTAPAQGVRA